jgi:hypothetical protein
MATLRFTALAVFALLVLAVAAPGQDAALEESPIYLCEVHDAGGFVGMFVIPTDYSENPVLDILIAAGAEDEYFLALAAAYAAVGDTRLSELMLYGMGEGEVLENWYMNTDEDAPYLFISITGDKYEVMFFALQGSGTPFCAYINDASRGVSPLGVAMTYFPFFYWRAELSADELSLLGSELKRISTEWDAAAAGGS